VKPGGAFFGPIHMAERAGMEPFECAVIGTYDLDGVLLDANMAPASTKGTASVKPESGAVKATTIKPKALELKGESMVWCMLEMPPPPPLQKDLGKSRTLLQEASSMGTCRCRLKTLLLPP
jgi:hypothetical protein